MQVALKQYEGDLTWGAKGQTLLVGIDSTGMWGFRYCLELKLEPSAS